MERESNIIDGKQRSLEIQGELKEKLIELKENNVTWRIPLLVVVTVAPTKATLSYLAHKKSAAMNCGIAFKEERFDSSISQEQLNQKCKEITSDVNVTAVIVQLPLPDHLKMWEVVQFIPQEKDVDGLNAQNQGLIQVGLPCLMPCTPQGVLDLLHHFGLIVKGQHAVVIGRSPLVGKPVANLLLGREANMSVTVVHRHVADLKKHTLDADIIVSCVGKADLITADMVKEGVVIIDVGINFVEDQTRKTGVRMCGDVSPDVYPKCRAYTPVPGGVGPMTVAMLMRNTVIAALRQQGLPELDEGWRNRARTNPQ